MKPRLLCHAAAISLLLGTSSAFAGLYSDDMARCLVSATTTKDKTDLVRWIFSNAALHPEVASISSITPERRAEINRLAGALLERLLTESCRKQTQDALKYEGQLAMQTSFQVLGQVAMLELMSNPAVGAGFSGIGKYIDETKLKELAPGTP
jgi:hypothetical protein